MAIKKKKVSVPSVWMTVYGDMITNLTLFFIMLFASIVIALKKGYSEEEFKEYMLRGIKSGVYHEEIKNQTYIETGRKLSEIQGIEGIRIGENELRIILPELVLFDKSLAKIKESGLKTLTEIGGFFSDKNYRIVVEGHTCDTPMIMQEPPKGKKRWQLALERATGMGPYYSNRELSAARALQVVKFFTREKLLKPEKISAEAYGPISPAAPNINEENRQKNRRIEIRVFPETAGRI